MFLKPVPQNVAPVFLCPKFIFILLTQSNYYCFHPTKNDLTGNTNYVYLYHD